MFLYTYILKTVNFESSKLVSLFIVQLSFELKINKIEMSSGQTPRPISNTAPARASTNRFASPSSTTAPSVGNTTGTPAQGLTAPPAPATTPVNRSPATTHQPPASTTVQQTQVHPISTVTQRPEAANLPTSITPIIGENLNELIIITEGATYDKLLNDVGNKYLLVEFYAPWCGACMLINKKLEELATSYSGKLIIAKVNIDECEQIAIDNNVSMMPSFMLLKENQVLENFFGSSEEKLMSIIQKHVGEPTNVGNDTGPTAGQAQQGIPITPT